MAGTGAVGGAASAAGANPASGAPQQRQRTPYKESDLEVTAVELDKDLKFIPPQRFIKPLDKRQKLIAAGEFNMSGKTSNLAMEGKAQLDKARTIPKGTRKSMTEAKAQIKDAVGRAQVLIANSGYSPDRAFYKTSGVLAKGIKTMVATAYDDDSTRFVRELIRDLETVSPSTVKYYQKDFTKAKEACREEAKETQQAA